MGESKLKRIRTEETLMSGAGEQAATEDDLSLSDSDLVGILITHLSHDVPILIHSMNPTRAPLISQRLNRAGFDVTRIPFEDLCKETFNGWLEDAHFNWTDKGQGNE